MTRVTTTLGLLALCLAVPSSAIRAQDIEHGLWSGAMTPPGAEPVPVMFQVGDFQGELRIVMSNPQLGPMELNDEVLEGDELTFWWNPGTRVECALHRQDDGSFEGVCADERGADGGEGAVRMTPPGA